MYNPQLKTFLAVTDAGSFLKAAEKLYISAPAVMQQINLLEDACGVKLFVRTHRGVKLTPAGEILYRDAQKIIFECEDTLARMRSASFSSENTVRIGTSLLFKCRMLPQICNEVREMLPEMHFELPNTPGQLTKENDFSELGDKYDLLEGIYCTICWKGLCSFLELSRTPVACAVSKNHPFAKREKLTLDDLAGQTLVMPMERVSEELDAFRYEVAKAVPGVRIIDSPYFGLDTFTLCEMNPYILITQPVYADIHTNLVTIPLETDYTLPYGIIYAKEPSAATQKFICAVKKLQK